MARKTTRRVAASKRKKSPTRNGKKSSAVSVEDFVRCIRTLHSLGLVVPFVRSAKRSKLTLTMNTAAFERVKKSVNKRRKPAPVSASVGSGTSIGLAKGAKPSPGKDPFDFGSNAPPGGLGGVKPLPGHDPFDF